MNLYTRKWIAGRKDSDKEGNLSEHTKNMYLKIVTTKSMINLIGKRYVHVTRRHKEYS